MKSRPTRDSDSFLTDLICSGLDTSSADPALLRRIRTFNVSTLTLVALAIPLTLLTLTMESPWLAGLLAAVIAFSLGNIYLLRWTRRPELSGHLGTAVLFAFLAAEAFSSGGFYHPSFSWLYVIPVVAGTVIGGRGCLIWVAICCFSVVGFWLIAPPGFEPTSGVSPHFYALTSLFSRLSAVIALGILAIGFTAAQRQLEVQLRERSQEQQQEAGFSRLLYEAAVVSNASSSPSEVLRSSAELICRTLGWPIAQVYSTSTEDRKAFRPTAIRFVAEDVEQSAVRDDDLSGGGCTQDLPTRAMLSGTPLWIPDVRSVRSESSPARSRVVHAGGLGAALLIPVQMGDGVTAVLEFLAREPLEQDSRLLGALEQIAVQIGHAAQRVRASEHLRSLVYYDSLTGLPNRLFFQERLGLEVRSAGKSETSLALFFLDLDGFKSINDTLGHEAGDQLLASVASRLSRTVRVSDCVARAGGTVLDDEGGTLSRLGGDEFTVLLPGISNRDEAAKTGQRLLDAFRQPFRVGSRNIFSGVSIGIAFYPDDGEDMSSLLRNADAAMYHAKERGRNNFQFFKSALGDSGSRRLALEERLARAVENEEFELYYQLVRNTGQGHIVGAEALLRWNDSELGWVSPAEFIPVAERCGQIGPLGSWVIRTAAAQAAAWIDAGLQPLRVSVNVSGHQLRHPSIVPTIRNALAHNRLDASLLELELTESTIMQDDQVTNEILREITDMGVGLALDDFGTGYSSLAYLRRLPIRRVKIDRGFIADIPDSHDDCALVGAIIAMAHSLRIAVVAEGVENEAQLEFLRVRGCDDVQGHLFSKAVPAAALARKLVREKREDEPAG